MPHFNAISRSPIFSFIVIISWIVIVIASMVMLGWVIKDPVLVQIFPNYVPMQFNTAFCMLLSALGLLTSYRFPRIKLVLALLLLLVSLATLIQYIAGINFGIDELFAKTFITTKTFYPGRMAPNTVVTFIFIAIALFLYNNNMTAFGYKYSGFILSLIVFCLAGLALIGYLLNFPQVYQWGKLTGMALHTALNFFLLSVGLLLLYWHNIFFHFKSRVQDLLFSAMTAIIGFSIVILIWQILLTAQHKLIENKVADDTYFLASTIKRYLLFYEAALKRMKDRIWLQVYTDKIWEVDRKNYLLDMDGLLDLDVFNRQGERFYYNGLKINKNLASCLNNFNTDKINIPTYYYPKQITLGYLCLGYKTLIKDQAFYFVSVIQINKIIEAIRNDLNQKKFFLEIFAQGNLFYADKNSSSNYQETFGRSEKINIDDFELNLKLWPREAYIKQNFTWLPSIVLFFGAIFIGSLSYIIYLFFLIKQKNKSLNIATEKSRASEKKFKAVVDTTNPIFVINKEKKIIFYNNSAAQLTGFSKEDFLYLKRKDLIVKEKSRHDKKTRVLLKTKLNEKIPVKIRARNVFFNKQYCQLLSVTDMRDQVKFEEILRWQSIVGKLLYESTTIVANTQDFKKALQQCLVTICERLGWPVGHVYIFDEIEQKLYPSRIWYQENTKLSQGFYDVTMAKSFSYGEGLPGMAWQTKTTQWVEDSSLKEYFTRHKGTTQSDLHSAVGIPIMIKENICAVIECFSNTIISKKTEYLSLFNLFSQQISRLFERNLYQQEITMTNQKLSASNRELEQFAYIISHDLKAPLRAIDNLAACLEEDNQEKLNEENVKNLRKMRERVARMTILIKAILEYSKAGKVNVEIEEINIHKMLNEIIDSLDPPNDLKIEIHGDVPVFKTAAIPLQQVFSNLISNAIKYHPTKQGKIDIYLEEENDIYFRFTVADDGNGIAEEFHEKIFKLFQTLQKSDNVDSTGIGLTIVKKLIESQGGQISVTKNYPNGARFSFTWPKVILEER